MVLRYILLTTILFLSCSERTTTKSNVKKTVTKDIVKKDTVTNLNGYKILTKPDTTNYIIAKKEVALLRIQLKKRLKQKKITLDSVENIFTKTLLNKIIPYWYGTTWSFNGHTNKPNKGEIACGYFISTTLKDMGLNLNRYKLAQKSPIDEANFLSCGVNVFTINDEYNEAITKIQEFTSSGIYFIGFDKGHVGYLLNQNGRLFLIHSNYLEPSKVIIESIEKSAVFKSFRIFHILPISSNKLLISKWLNNIEV